MNFIRKKYKTGANGIKAAKDRAVTRVAIWISKLQFAFVTLMDRKINPLPLVQKKILLYGFCLSLASFSCWLIIRPLIVKKKSYEVKIGPIELPKSRDVPGDQAPRGFISRDQYSRIHAFKVYLDSLASDKDGKKMYDSFLVARPGLVDSLRLFEAYYQMQK